MTDSLQDTLFVCSDVRSLFASWQKVLELTDEEGQPTSECVAAVTTLAMNAPQMLPLGPDDDCVSVSSAIKQDPRRAKMIARKLASFERMTILSAVCALPLNDRERLELLLHLGSYGDMRHEILQETIEALHQSGHAELIDQAISHVHPWESDSPHELQIRSYLFAYQLTKDAARLPHLRTMMRAWQSRVELSHKRSPFSAPAVSDDFLVQAQEGTPVGFIDLWVVSQTPEDLDEARRSAERRCTQRGQILAFLFVFEETRDPKDLLEGFVRVERGLHNGTPKHLQSTLFDRAQEAFIRACHGFNRFFLRKHTPWTQDQREAFIIRMDRIFRGLGDELEAALEAFNLDETIERKPELASLQN